MATPSPTLRHLASAGRSHRLPALLREPLVHFLALGALLFALDHFMAARDDPHVIIVDPSVDRQAHDVFKAARGRDPNDEELYALRRVWLDNEVLYREGLAMQVDKGDDAIRERVIFKALSVIDASVKLPQYDDESLREWFENRRGKYDEPARYDFQEAVLEGSASEVAVREFAEALNKGAPGDARAGLRIFKARPRGNVVDAYGADFAQALAEARPGEWRAYRTRDGWRAIRLDAVTPGKPAVYETLRGVVLRDWTDSTMSEQRSAVVRDLARKYTVRYERVN